MTTDAEALSNKAKARNSGEFLSMYELVYDFGNLYEAYRKSRRGKRGKISVARFEVNALEAVMYISYLLKERKYKMAPYNTFIVYEPKKRMVMSNSFVDKVVQHSLCDNVLEPVFTRSFILDNYASQRGKGTHFGLDRLREFMRRYYRKHGPEGWVLKADISKYFYSIRHEPLRAMIYKMIEDDGVRWLVDMIIDSTPDPGIPIGNQTSQLFALLYLNGMDHFIKEKLGIKYYGRYMDDFYLIHEDKSYLKKCLAQIKEQLVPLGLELNSKTQIFPLRHGIDFLGFRTFMTDTGKVVRKIRRVSKNNTRRKLKKFYGLVQQGRMSMDAVHQSYQSWRGHAQHGNSYHLINRMDKLYDELFKDMKGVKPDATTNNELERRGEN